MRFDPIENNRRLARVVNAVSIAESIQFSSVQQGRHVVLFQDPIDHTIDARIRIYQDNIHSYCGAYPEIVMTMPGCLRVFFWLPPLTDLGRHSLESFFKSKDFESLRKELKIDHVQIFGKVFHRG